MVWQIHLLDYCSKFVMLLNRRIISTIFLLQRILQNWFLAWSVTKLVGYLQSFFATFSNTSCFLCVVSCFGHKFKKKKTCSKTFDFWLLSWGSIDNSCSLLKCLKISFNQVFFLRFWTEFWIPNARSYLRNMSYIFGPSSIGKRQMQVLRVF